MNGFPVKFQKENDPRLLSYYNAEDDALARKLYGPDSYTVLKGFLSHEERDAMLDTWFQHRDQVKTYENKNYRFSHIHIDCKTEEPRCRTVRLTMERVFRKRLEITMQPSSDQFLFHHCRSSGIDPEDSQSIMNDYMRHSWCRFMHYHAGDFMDAHLDAPGEIQAIIPLTRKGVDYAAGGLFLGELDGSRTIEVDSLLEPGDMILLNAYRKVHWVEPIESLPEQRGRIQFFVPIVPEYIHKTHDPAHQTY